MPQKHKGNKAKLRKPSNGNKNKTASNQTNTTTTTQISSQATANLVSGRRKANSTSQLICSVSSIDDEIESFMRVENCDYDQNNNAAANKNCLTNKFQILSLQTENLNTGKKQEAKYEEPAVNVARQSKPDQDSGHSSPNENAS